jgi:hypothetical protein
VGDYGYGTDFSWIIWLSIIGGVIGFAAKILIPWLIHRHTIQQRWNPSFNTLNPMESILRLTFQAYFHQYNTIQQDYMRLFSALQAAHEQNLAQAQLAHRQAAVQAAQHRIEAQIARMPEREQQAHRAKLSDVVQGKVRLNSRMEIIED